MFFLYSSSCFIHALMQCTLSCSYLAKVLNIPSNLTPLSSPLKPPWYPPVPTCFEWTKTAKRRRRWEVTLPRRSSSHGPHFVPRYHAGIWLPPYPCPAPLLLPVRAPTLKNHLDSYRVSSRLTSSLATCSFLSIAWKKSTRLTSLLAEECFQVSCGGRSKGRKIWICLAGKLWSKCRDCYF